MKNKKTLFFIIFGLIIVPISAVIATIELEMQTDWPRSPIPGGIGLDPTSTITDLIQYLYEWGIALGGLITFVALLIAGFLYLTSVGDPTKMKDAMDRIKAAFLGLALLLGSWLILHTINPELTTLNPITFPEDIPQAQIPIKIGELTQVKSCTKMLMFKQPGFKEKDPKMLRPREQEKRKKEDIPMSYVMCREIRCRDVICEPIRQGETRHDLCPEGQTVIKKDREQIGKFGCPDNKVPAEIPRTDDLCQMHSGEKNLVEGGACSLQIASGARILWWRCGGPIAEIPGPRITNLANIMSIDDIECLKLVGHGI